MQNTLTLVLDKRTGQYRLPSHQKSHVRRNTNSGECPAWLKTKFLSARIYHAFNSGGSTPAIFERVEKMKTGQWSAVYSHTVIANHDLNQKWKEHYRYVLKDGDLKEIGQWGGPTLATSRRKLVKIEFV